MAVRDERRAVLVLALLAAAGGVVRVARPSSGAPGAALVAPRLSGEDIVRQAQMSRQAEALARPLLPGERVDVDTAGVAVLDRLPRIGRELARRIVEERDARGPFGSLQGLRRVSGIGPAMLASLERTTTFSGRPRPIAASALGPAPGAGPMTPTVGPASCPREGGRVALNRAGAEELACLPGVGPALAARIVADRAARGPFNRPEELDRVRGIRPQLLTRLRPLVTAP